MTIWLASTPADPLSAAEARNSPRLFHRIECLPALLFFASAGHGPALPIFASAGHGPALPIFASGSAGRWPATRDPARAHSTLCGRTFRKEARHVAWHAPLASIGRAYPVGSGSGRS